MKKLMTMIAAVATAFGLYAATPDSGTSFEAKEGVEAFEGGALAEVLDDLEELYPAESPVKAADYWDLSKITGSATATVTKFASGEAPEEDDRSDKFDSLVNDYYLALETSTNELTRYVVDEGGRISHDAEGGNIFFDSFVKLSAFDGEPEIADNAKVAVWLFDKSELDTGAEAVTNLMVTIDTGDGDGIKSYNCGIYDGLVDTWTRVTIKAMKVVDGQIGFVIYLNGNETPVKDVAKSIVYPTGLTPAAKVYADAFQLFPLDTEKGTTISSVAFAGKGAVDDILFTEEAPAFAKDYLQYTVTWDPEKVGTVTFDPAATSFDPVNGTATFLAKTLPKSIDMDWLPNATWAAGGVTLTPSDGGSYTLGNDDYSKGVAQVNELAYADIGIAIQVAAVKEMPVVLLDTITEAIEVEDDVTIDLNGQNVTVEEGDVITVIKSATLTIVDDDNTSVISSGSGGYAIASEEGVVIIGAGTYAGGVSLSDGCELNGGLFSTTDNEKDYLDDYATPGYEFVDNEAGYFELQKIPATYMLTVVQPANGLITTIPEAGQKYTAGTVVTVTAQANEGYSVEEVMLNGVAITDNTFEMPEEAAEVTASITANVYKVTFDTDDGEAFADQEYTFGTGDITLNIYDGKKTGFNFAGWTNEVAGTALIANGAKLENIVGGYALKAVWESAGPVPPTSDEGTIGKPDSSTGIAAFTPKDNSVTSATVDLGEFTGKISFPKQIKTITGVPEAKIVIMSGDYDITEALAFTGDEATGITYDLNPEAVVSQVPVTPTIAAQDDSGAFDIVGGTMEVKGIAGLWYSLVGADEVTEMADATLIGASVQATDTGAKVTLKDTTEVKTAAQFYQVKVSIDPLLQ